MRMKIGGLLGAGLIAAAVATAGPAGAQAPAPDDSLGVDKDGQEVHVSDFHGKVLVASFWASWCGPCLQELPILENLQNSGARDQIKVVAINDNESEGVYRQIRRRMSRMSMTLTHDDEGRAAQRLGVQNIPHMFIYDRNGRLAFEHTGYSDKTIPDLVTEINQLLAQP
jgi:thiol-disulfide isomerase/thioredoxin